MSLVQIIFNTVLMETITSRIDGIKLSLDNNNNEKGEWTYEYNKNSKDIEIKKI